MAQTSWLSALVEDLGQALFGDEGESLRTQKTQTQISTFPLGLKSVGEVYQHSYNALVKVHTTGQYSDVMPLVVRDSCDDFIDAVVMYDFRIRLFSQKWRVPSLSYFVWQGTMSMLIPGAMAELDIIEPPLSDLGEYERHALATTKLLALYVALNNN